MTIIGGWAVHDLVEGTVAQQSRDVDIVLHDEAALDAFDRKLPDWNLVWRRSGRRRFKDCHFKDDPVREIFVDVFTLDPIGAPLFGTQLATNLKPETRGQALLPTLEFLLRDKLRTAPARSGPEQSLKQLKDLMDIRNLVFFNRERRLSADVRGLVTQTDRDALLAVLAEVLRDHPDFGDPLGDLRSWLAG